MLNKILFALLVPVAAFAQVVCTFPEPPAASKQPEVPGIQAFSMTKAPVIDGKLDDEAWKGAPVLENFVWLRRLGNVKLQSFANQKIDEQGAIPVSHGDAGFQFQFLGQYQMQILVWEGDEEFPPNAQVIYSDNFAEGFAAEDRVVAGDILISVIKSNM